DNGDGTYTATLTSATSGTATITAYLGTDKIGRATCRARVGITAGAAEAGTSTVAADPAADVTADGTAASTITVTIRDADNNIRTGGGDDVFLSTDLGTLGAVVDNGDGTYTATLVSTTSGTATVTAYLGTDADGRSEERSVGDVSSTA